MHYICACVIVLDILFSEKVYTMGTRGAWSRDFLVALGNPNPSAKTVNLVSAWTKAEGTDAKFNPLATTLDYGTNTKFNSVGVRNYQTRQQGIEATAITLRGKWTGYSKTLQGLQTDNPELALDGMLTTGMPWGTNFGTVAAYYHSKDVTGELLASESGSSTSSSSLSHTTSKTEDDTTPPPKGLKTESTNTMVAGTVTENDVRRYAKIALGATIGVVGSILIIKSMISFDTLKTAAKVAAL